MINPQRRTVTNRQPAITPELFRKSELRMILSVRPGSLEEELASEKSSHPPVTGFKL